MGMILMMVSCRGELTSPMPETHLTPTPVMVAPAPSLSASPSHPTREPVPTDLQALTPIPALVAYLDQIRADWEGGRSEDALTALDALIAAEPGYGEALMQRALYRISRGDRLRGFEDLSRVIALSPERADAYLLRGDLFIQAGEAERALVDLNIALALNPALAEALLLRAPLLMARGEPEKALADYEEAVAAGLGDEDSLLQLGILYNQIEAYQLAKKALNQSFTLGGGGYALWYQLAYADLFLADFGAALAEINLALAEEAESIEALSLRGTIYLNMAVWSAAMGDFEHVLALAPDTIDAYYGLAQAQVGAGRPEEAIESLENYLAEAEPGERNYDAVRAFLILLRRGAATPAAEATP